MRLVLATYQLKPGVPALTAAQIASILAATPQAIRKKLRHHPANGKTTVSGNLADTWDAAALPAALATRLARASRAKGYSELGDMIRAGISAWKSPAPLSEIADECLSEAAKLKSALLPSLQKRFVISQADFVREGLDDFEGVFNHRITERHFRNLVCRTVDRDGGAQNWERLELYLPKKPARKAKPAAPKQNFPLIIEAINAVSQVQTVKDNHLVGISQDETIWRAVFQTRQALLAAGCAAKRADRELRTFICERAPGLVTNRDALRKAYERRLARCQAGELFDKRSANGAEDGGLTKQIKALPWFITAARFFYLLTNRTKDSGSVPEAVRRVISLPNLPVGWGGREKFQLAKRLGLKSVRGALIDGFQWPVCPAELRETILARQNAGTPMVPATIARQIAVNPATVRQYRNPTNAALDFLNSPGGMRLFTIGNGDTRLARAGEIMEADDATINFPVCVPWQNGGDKCSEKYGVRVGRFQWLVAIDAGTSYVTGYNYTMRPRGSYRAEDVVSLMRAVCGDHGIPRRWRLERGVWKSGLVANAIKNLGSSLDTVYSPHQKPFIEGLFNVLWTKLSVHFPHAHVGRFMGEHERANDLLTQCQAGRENPRRHFPMLAAVIAAFDDVIAEKNQTPVVSKYHGRWVPADRWHDEIKATPQPKLDPADEWIFYPFVKTWTVRGMIVGGKVPIFEGMSVPFDFTSPYLPAYDGQEVRCHFDPRSPKGRAKIVLASNGKIIGDAEPLSDTAGYIRFVMGWGGMDGSRARQQAAAAMRREVRGIVPKGRGYSHSEERDGLGKTGIIQRGGADNRPADDKAQSRRRLDRNLAGGDLPEVPYDGAARRAEAEEFERQHEHLFT